VISQARRYRRAPNPRERQQSRLLLMALSLALTAAVLLMGLSVVLTGASSAEKTVNYEFTPPAPGVYFFRCDPHPVDMVGKVVVTPAERATTGTAPAQAVRISAANSRFNKDELALTAGRRARVLFTSHDSDLHNIAIYDSPRLERSIFIGEEFSGQDLTARIFRIFRLLFIALPIALFIGILRFHLWDIDRVINRALVYTILTGILAVTYLGSIVLLGSVLRRLALVETNDVALVASTLGVAALFRPAQRRVQALIDERFFRRRYNAVKTIEAFTTRLRDHIELETLKRELIAVTQATMEPAHVSVWLKPPVGDAAGGHRTSTESQGSPDRRTGERHPQEHFAS
jgi:plastocyanin